MGFLAIILMVAVMSSSEYLDNDILAMTNEFNRQLNYWAELALKKIFGKVKVCSNKINMKQAGQFTTYIKVLPKGGIQTYKGEAIVWNRIERTVLFTPLAVYLQLAKYGVQLERHLLPAKRIVYGCCGAYENHGGCIVCVITNSFDSNKCNKV